MLGELADAGFEIGEQTLARVPAGFSKDAPRADLLRFTVVHAIQKVSPPPGEFESSEFVGWCMEHFERVAPLVEWLVEAIG